MGYSKIKRIFATKPTYVGILNPSLAKSVTFQKFHFLSHLWATGEANSYWHSCWTWRGVLMLRKSIIVCVFVNYWDSPFLKVTAARWKSMFCVHYNFCAQDYCDDWWCIWVRHLSGFMSTHQLQRIVLKRLLHRKCIAKFRNFIILS